MKINPFSMEVGDIATGYVCLQDVTSDLTKRNSRFVRGKGVFEGLDYNIICWDENLVDTLIGDTKVFQVCLQCGSYENEKQYTIKEVYSVETEADPLEYFIKVDVNDIHEKFTEFIDANFGSVYKELISKILPDSVMNLFKAATASTYHHDNFCGGLVYHSYKVMRILNSLIDIYGLEKKREFMLLCALVHDIGKMLAIDYKSMEYTAQGSKLSHEALGIMYLTGKSKVILKYLTRDEFDTLLGVVENHRGHDFGANPTTLEAYLVHYADYIEAHTTALLTFIESQQNILTSPKAVKFGGHRVYVETKE